MEDSTKGNICLCLGVTFCLISVLFSLNKNYTGWSFFMFLWLISLFLELRYYNIIQRKKEPEEPEETIKTDETNINTPVVNPTGTKKLKEQ